MWNVCTNPVLVASCLVYLTNVGTCWMMGEYTYAKWFMALVATSILVHTNTNTYTILIDKVPITGIVLYGGYTYYRCIYTDRNNRNIIEMEKGGRVGGTNVIGVYVPLASFIVVCILYIVGYWMRQFCFDSEHKISTRYHALVHLISSIGHHAILLLLV